MQIKKTLISGNSNIGIREKNQDFFGFEYKNDSILAILCDGIGSHQFSELISVNVVKKLLELYKNTKKIKSFESFFKKNIIKVQKYIDDVVNKVRNLERYTIGSTMVTCFIDNKNNMYVINLGDSRLFHYSNKKNEIIQITIDQNQKNYIEKIFKKKEQELLKKKNNKLDLEILKINKEEQLVYDANILDALTNCIESNTNDYKEYETFNVKVEEKDIILLCSDGFYNFIDLNSVIKKLKNIDDNDNLNKFVIECVNQSIKNKSTDNSTLIAIKII